MDYTSFQVLALFCLLSVVLFSNLRAIKLILCGALFFSSRDNVYILESIRFYLFFENSVQVYNQYISIHIYAQFPPSDFLCLQHISFPNSIVFFSFFRITHCV